MKEVESQDRLRRLRSVCVAGGLLGLGNHIYDVLGPLWATTDLGLAPSEWAGLRSLRFTGTVIGTVLFALVATRVTPRLTASLALAAAGACLAAMVLGGALWLWALVPVFGAGVSIAYVNLNALVQQAGGKRRGAANAWYRGSQAGVGIVAPVIATSLAGWWGGYVPALLVGSVTLIAAAAAVLAHPLAAPRLGPGLRWGPILSTPGLRRFIAIDQCATLVQSAWPAYFALRLAREVGLSDTSLGFVLMAGGGAAFAVTIASGWLTDRLPVRVVLAAAWLVMAMGMALLGFATTPIWAIVGHILASIGSAVNVIATSVNIGRLAGNGGEALAFTAAKVVQAAATAVGMAAVAILGARWGMGPTLLIGAAGLSVVAGVGWFLLPRGQR